MAGTNRITHGSQRRIWQMKRNGGAVVEGNRRAAKGEEKHDTEEGLKSKLHQQNVI